MPSKYRISPFNLICVGIIVFTIWAAINPGPEGWGFLLPFYSIPVVLFVLFIDFLGQIYFSTRRIFMIEVFAITILLIWYSFTQKSKTYIIPDNLISKYVVTIYNVDGAPKLPAHFLRWHYNIAIPKNGVLLTSSSYESDFPETKMKTETGKEFNTENTNWAFGRLRDDEINCNEKKYKYRSWLVDSVSCCGYSSQELDTLRINIENNFCGNKLN